MLTKRSFKTRDEVEITFELGDAASRQAEVLCDATGWTPIAMKRTNRGKGPFQAKMRFPKGRRVEFRYRLDGERWANDEAADEYRPNGFGTTNGIVHT